MTTEWFYNEIMRHVEPALMSNRIQESMKRGEKESPEDFAMRLRHFEDAKHVFAAVSQDLGSMLEQDGTRLHKTKRHALQERERTEDAGGLEHIETDLNNPPPPA